MKYVQAMFAQINLATRGAIGLYRSPGFTSKNINVFDQAVYD